MTKNKKLSSSKVAKTIASKQLTAGDGRKTESYTSSQLRSFYVTDKKTVLEQFFGSATLADEYRPRAAKVATVWMKDVRPLRVTLWAHPPSTRTLVLFTADNTKAPEIGLELGQEALGPLLHMLLFAKQNGIRPQFSLPEGHDNPPAISIWIDDDAPSEK